ncbi:MAG: S-layer homology domain-containing protein [Oscillospiraceae bacterium]|nr:S-layer homology domain-containing protein [Bacillota bacterium]
MKTRISALLLALVLVLTMTTGAWAAGTGSERTAEARLTMTAEYRAGNAVVTVYLEGGEGVTNGRLTATYDPKVSTLTGSRVLGSFGASSVNGETAGEVCLAWVGSNLTAEKTPMVELTFQVTQDGTFTAEASEVYAGEEKRTVEGDAVSLAYNPFQDIENHWAKEEILKAYHEGLFQGVTETKFIPEGKMDRAMFVTVLYRLAGNPAVESLETAFTDVDTAQYYGAAVAWAVEHGVTNGVSQTQFAPHQAISRQELVTMLYRYAKATGQDVTGQADLGQFVDAGKVADWAEAPVAWAVKEEILEGYPGSYLLPRGSATRAQAAAIFCRYGQL